MSESNDEHARYIQRVVDVARAKIAEASAERGAPLLDDLVARRPPPPRPRTELPSPDELIAEARAELAAGMVETAALRAEGERRRLDIDADFRRRSGKVLLQ
jgi:hypothetical protein